MYLRSTDNSLKCDYLHSAKVKRVRQYPMQVTRKKYQRAGLYSSAYKGDVCTE